MNYVIFAVLIVILAPAVGRAQSSGAASGSSVSASSGGSSSSAAKGGISSESDSTPRNGAANKEMGRVADDHHTGNTPSQRTESNNLGPAGTRSASDALNADVKKLGETDTGVLAPNSSMRPRLSDK